VFEVWFGGGDFMSREEKKGKDTQVKGKIREEVGKLTGNKNEQIKGKAEQVVGKIHEEVGKAKKKVAEE
jgi:uncharacterized protein YjbJ (UPF0337 family)